MLTILFRSTLASTSQMSDEWSSTAGPKYKEAGLMEMLNYLQWFKSELERNPNAITAQDKQVVFLVYNTVMKEKRRMAQQKMRQHAWYSSRGQFF